MKFEIEFIFYERMVAGEKPRDIIQHMVSTGEIANPKQAWRTLEKWLDAYDYGVSLDLGWLINGKYPGALLRRQRQEHSRLIRENFLNSRKTTEEIMLVPGNRIHWAANDILRIKELEKQLLPIGKKISDVEFERWYRENISNSKPDPTPRSTSWPEPEDGFVKKIIDQIKKSLGIQ